MMKKRVLITGLLLASALGILGLPVLAGRGQEYPPNMKGNQIIVGVDTTLSADEPCYVIHGWIWPDWSTSSVEEKQVFRQYIFELEIDDEEVPLKRRYHYYQTFEKASITYEKVMFVGYYVKYKANSFTPGTYIFSGTWTDSNGIAYNSQCEVTFT